MGYSKIIKSKDDDSETTYLQKFTANIFLRQSIFKAHGDMYDLITYLS